MKLGEGRKCHRERAVNRSLRLFFCTTQKLPHWLVVVTGADGHQRPLPSKFLSVLQRALLLALLCVLCKLESVESGGLHDLRQCVVMDASSHRQQVKLCWS